MMKRADTILIRSLGILGFVIVTLFACGRGDTGSAENQSTVSATEGKEEEEVIITMTESTGIGPVDKVELDEAIDEEMAKKGKKVFGNLCTVCHQIDVKVVGPALKNVTKRRKPEWIMNMILNPVEMIEDDPVAHELYLEYETPMNQQAVSREEARQILEYLRMEDQ